MQATSTFDSHKIVVNSIKTEPIDNEVINAAEETYNVEIKEEIHIKDDKQDHSESNHDMTDTSAIVAQMKLPATMTTTPPTTEPAKRHPKNQRIALVKKIPSDNERSVETIFIKQEKADDLVDEEDGDSTNSTGSENHKRAEKNDDPAVATDSNKKRLKCPHCDRQCTSPYDLRRHLLKHTGEKPFKCQFCDVSCTRLCNLKEHELIHTGGLKGGTCKYCGKFFPRLSNLKVHEHTHEKGKFYECKMCGVKVTQQGALKIHMRKHTGERPYKCKQCDMTFIRGSSLRRHERTHTDEKRYICKYCSKSLSSSDSLKNHERLHTGEKPYQCKLCTKSFFNAESLKAHDRRHKGEKPFKCSACDKAYRNLISLRRHEVKHPRESNYKCPSCSISFFTVVLLNKHLESCSNGGGGKVDPDECGPATDGRNFETVTVLIKQEIDSETDDSND